MVRRGPRDPRPTPGAPTGWSSPADKPTGPYNRVCDNRLARELLGWEPAIAFRDGVRATADWYFAHHSREEVARTLGRRLLERT